jgi:hypothetical protein
MTPADRDHPCGAGEEVTPHEAPAIAALERRGYTAEFVVDDDALRVANTDRRYRPEDVRIRHYCRFEGISDPDDMAVVYALEASDGTRGTLTDAFGTYADPAVGRVVERMRVARAAASRRWRGPDIGAALGALTVAAALVVARRRAA